MCDTTVGEEDTLSPELEVIKDIPCYRVILKAVLRHQIQQLLQQLSEYTEEESVILSASLSDGQFSHLGTASGKVFLEQHEELKTSFLNFCLKRHNGQTRPDAPVSQCPGVLSYRSQKSNVDRLSTPGSPSASQHSYTVPQTCSSSLTRSQSQASAPTTQPQSDFSGSLSTIKSSPQPQSHVKTLKIYSNGIVSTVLVPSLPQPQSHLKTFTMDSSGTVSIVNSSPQQQSHLKTLTIDSSGTVSTVNSSPQLQRPSCSNTFTMSSTISNQPLSLKLVSNSPVTPSTNTVNSMASGTQSQNMVLMQVVPTQTKSGVRGKPYILPKFQTGSGDLRNSVTYQQKPMVHVTRSLSDTLESAGFSSQDNETNLRIVSVQGGVKVEPDATVWPFPISEPVVKLEVSDSEDTNTGSTRLTNISSAVSPDLSTVGTSVLGLNSVFSQTQQMSDRRDNLLLSDCLVELTRIDPNDNRIKRDKTQSGNRQAEKARGPEIVSGNEASLSFKTVTSRQETQTRLASQVIKDQKKVQTLQTSSVLTGQSEIQTLQPLSSVTGQQKIQTWQSSSVITGQQQMQMLQPSLVTTDQQKIQMLQPSLVTTDQQQMQMLQPSLVTTGQQQMQMLQPSLVTTNQQKIQMLQPSLVTTAQQKIQMLQPSLVTTAQQKIQMLQPSLVTTDTLTTLTKHISQDNHDAAGAECFAEAVSSMDTQTERVMKGRLKHNSHQSCHNSDGSCVSDDLSYQDDPADLDYNCTDNATRADKGMETKTAGLDYDTDDSSDVTDDLTYGDDPSDPDFGDGADETSVVAQTEGPGDDSDSSHGEDDDYVDQQEADDMEKLLQESAGDEVEASPGTEDFSTQGTWRQRWQARFRNISVESGCESKKRLKRMPKVSYCLYCKKKHGAKIARHYGSVHKGESRVKQAAEFPLHSKQRKMSFELLRNEGNFKHNIQVLQKGTGKLIVARKPSANSDLDAAKYIPCLFCLSFLNEKSAYLHARVCTYRPAELPSDCNYIRNEKLLLLPFMIQRLEREKLLLTLQMMIGKMKGSDRMPQLKDMCYNDELIREFGICELQRLGTNLCSSQVSNSQMGTGREKTKQEAGSSEVVSNSQMGTGGEIMKQGAKSSEFVSNSQMGTGGGKVKKGAGSSEVVSNSQMGTSGEKMMQGVRSSEVVSNSQMETGGEKIKQGAGSSEVVSNSQMGTGGGKVKEGAGSSEVVLNSQIGTGGEKMMQGVRSSEVVSNSQMETSGAKIKQGAESSEVVSNSQMGTGGENMKQGAGSSEVVLNSQMGTSGGKMKQGVRSSEVVSNSQIGTGGGKVTQSARRNEVVRQSAVTTRMRYLVLLLNKLNENQPAKQSLSDFLCGKKHSAVTNAMKNLTKTSTRIAAKMEVCLRHVCLLKISLSWKKNDQRRLKEAMDFNARHLSHLVNITAPFKPEGSENGEMQKIEKVDLLKTDDLEKLTNHCKREIEKAVEDTDLTYEKYVILARAIFVRMQLVNACTVGELEQLTVKEFDSRSHNLSYDCEAEEYQDVKDSLDMVEKALSQRMEVLVVTNQSQDGKREGCILLPSDVVYGLSYLLAIRDQVGVMTFNSYLFARNSPGHLDGVEAMRKVSASCPGIERPKVMRVGRKRKYMAKVCQMMEMTEVELHLVAVHLGKVLNIETSLERLLSSQVELCKAALLLVTIYSEELKQFEGQKLENIDRKAVQDLYKAGNADGTPVGMTDVETKADGTTRMSLDNDSESDSDTSLDEPQNKDMDADDKAQSSEEKEASDTDYEPEIKTRRLSKTTSVAGIIQKKRWTEEEETALRKAFKHQLANKLNVNAQSITDAQRDYPVLKSRSQPVIRTKINNIILNKQKTMF